MDVSVEVVGDLGGLVWDAVDEAGGKVLGWAGLLVQEDFGSAGDGRLCFPFGSWKAF